MVGTAQKRVRSPSWCGTWSLERWSLPVSPTALNCALAKKSTLESRFPPGKPIHSPELQELRGGRLDHESREMSEKRETATADRYQTIPRLAGVIASGRAEDSLSCSHTICTLCKWCVNKKQNVPCCRRRFGCSSGQTPGLNAHRVTPVNYTSYAVGIQIRHICSQRLASPAAAWYCFSFCTKFLHYVQKFCTKEWNLPPCRRRHFLWGQ